MWARRLTLSRTSFSKFLSAATLTHTQPSLSHSVLTLYEALGTAETTTSEMARQSCRVSVLGCTTCRGWYRVCSDSPDWRGRFVYSW